MKRCDQGRCDPPAREQPKKGRGARGRKGENGGGNENTNTFVESPEHSRTWYGGQSNRSKTSITKSKPEGTETERLRRANWRSQ